MLVQLAYNAVDKLKELISQLKGPVLPSASFNAWTYKKTSRNSTLVSAYAIDSHKNA